MKKNEGIRENRKNFTEGDQDIGQDNAKFFALN